MSGKRRPLNEEDKNELVLKYQNVVHYFGNKYRFFDPDIEEVKAWGFLGLAKAINRYENELDIKIETIVFSAIRKEILSQYSKNRRPKSEDSLQRVMFAGESSELTLEGSIVDDSMLVSERDIRMIVEEALAVESERFKRITMDYLFTQKDAERIAEENKVTQAMVVRTHRRGQALIKRHLISNGLILDHIITPDDEKGKKINDHKEILSSEFGKIKYIKKFYSFLNDNDIAFLIDKSSFMVSNLLDYPSTAYLQMGTDDSIKRKIIEYCQRKYPERIASEVLTIPFKDLQEIDEMAKASGNYESELNPGLNRHIANQKYKNRKSDREAFQGRKWN